MQVIYTRTFVLFSLTAPRVACLGEEVALFSLPFEARPTDPIRREAFRQTQSESGWFSPSVVPALVPPELAPSRQAPAGPVPKVKRRRKW